MNGVPHPTLRKKERRLQVILANREKHASIRVADRESALELNCSVKTIPVWLSKYQKLVDKNITAVAVREKKTESTRKNIAPAQRAVSVISLKQGLPNFSRVRKLLESQMEAGDAHAAALYRRWGHKAGKIHTEVLRVFLYLQENWEELQK